MVNPIPKRSSRSKSPVPKRIRSPVSDSWEAKAAQFLKSIGDDQAAFKLIQATRAKSPPLNERKTKTAKPPSTTPPPMEPQPTLEERLQKMKQHGLSQETSDAFAAFFAESQKRDSTSTLPKAAKKPHIQRSEDEKNKAELRKMLGVILSMQQLQREGLASMPMFFKVCDEMGINKEEVEKNHMLQQLLTLIAHNTPESQKASSLESMVSSLSAGSRNQAPISSVGNYSNVMSSSSLPTRSGPYGTNISSSMSSGSSFTSAPPEEPFSFVYPGLEDEESDKHKHRPEEVDSVIGRLTYAFGQSNSGASTATNKNLSTYDRFSYGHSEASRPVNSSWQPNYPTIGQSSLNLEAERSSKIPRESIQSKKNDEISVMYESRRAANVNKPTSSSTVGIPQGSLSVTANIPPQSSFDAGYGGSTLRSTTLGNRYSGDQQNTTTGLPTYNAFGSYTPRPGGTTQSSAYGMSGMSTNSTEQMNRQLWNVLNQNPRSNN
uniref:Uncharacterized protein n=1 Tax=Acrobeloides nanus TaxID=290746 RepID=A0A914CQS4_9BILA